MSLGTWKLVRLFCYITYYIILPSNIPCFVIMQIFSHYFNHVLIQYDVTQKTHWMQTTKKKVLLLRLFFYFSFFICINYHGFVIHSFTDLLFFYYCYEEKIQKIRKKRWIWEKGRIFCVYFCYTFYSSQLWKKDGNGNLVFPDDNVNSQ